MNNSNRYLNLRSTILLGMVLCLPFISAAQPATFDNLYDFNNWWDGSNTSIANDLGYLTISSTRNLADNDSTWNSHLHLLQTDHYGNKLWDKILLGIDSVNFSLGETDHAFRLPNGHYITSGFMVDFRDSVAKTSAYLLKFDSLGNPIWFQTYNERGYAGTTHLTVLPDGGFLFCGQSALDRQWNGLDIFLAKADSSGNLLWWEEYGSAGQDFCSRVITTPDQGFVVCGSVVLPGNNQRITTLIKTDAQGQQQWEKHYTATPYDNWGFACKPADTGYWLLSNAYTTPDQNHNGLAGFAIRLNSAFDSVWSFQQVHPDGLGFVDMLAMNNGDVVALGVTGTTGKNAAWLGRISGQGSLLWQRQFISRESGSDHLKHIIATIDHGLLMTGTARDADDNSPRQQNIWLVKTDTFGCVQPGCHLTDSRGDDPELSQQVWLKAGPNPFTDQTTLSYDLPPGLKGSFRLDIYDLSSGRLHQSYPVQPGQGQVRLRLDKPTSGLLVATLKQNDKTLAMVKLVQQQ